MATNKNNDERTREEAERMGEKGCEANSKNHDKEFYQEIGKKGGKANNSQNND